MSNDLNDYYKLTMTYKTSMTQLLHTEHSLHLKLIVCLKLAGASIFYITLHTVEQQE